MGDEGTNVSDWADGVGALGRPQLVVDGNPFERAGERLATEVLDLFRERSVVRLAISGGSALEAARIAREKLGDLWSRVVLTWVDERCVPMSSPDSNRGAAALCGLLGDQQSRLAISSEARSVAPDRVVPLYQDEESPAEAAARFERSWEEELDGAIDIALLGMGSDGHIASLFPGSTPEGSSTSGSDPRGMRCVAHVGDSPKPPSSRMTLTREALETAGRTILVAAGEEKRDALVRLLAGDQSLPAYGLPGLVVVTNSELANASD